MTAELTSWKDTATRRAIVDFVDRVTREGGPDFVAPDERIAVFDNDGTLWLEKPLPPELGFVLLRLAAMAEADETLRGRQPWKAAYEKDYGWLAGVMAAHYAGDDTDVRVLMGGMVQAFADMTVDDYQTAASSFLHKGTHPTLGRVFRDVWYEPMVELLRYLEAHGFTSYIASGGDRDFMRPVTQQIYGIPPERVIGSSNALEYQEDEQGGQVVYRARPDVFDDGPAKPVRIWSRIGRRPILAGGNSNGDIQMLRFAAHPSRPSLSLLVNHDDTEREIGYSTGSEEAIKQAAKFGWTVVSVKDDWATVFADIAAVV